MKVISLYPYDDVYQVIDEDGTVLFQGTEQECIITLMIKSQY
jgi:hypothetical protein